MECDNPVSSGGAPVHSLFCDSAFIEAYVNDLEGLLSGLNLNDHLILNEGFLGFLNRRTDTASSLTASLASF